ncbi:MAG: hypothetical protein ACXWBS_04695, partial [Chthoniobacterales bacterium]
MPRADPEAPRRIDDANRAAQEIVIGIKVLLEACDYYVAKKRRIMFEYILIAGVNGTDEQGRELAKIARRLHAKINLIRRFGMVAPIACAAG